MRRSLAKIAIVGAFAALLAGCVSSVLEVEKKAIQPIPTKLTKEMKTKGVTASGAVLVRIFKQESELEVWKRTPTGKFALLKTYPICRWSGDLGPKKKIGDRRAPEGFYTVNAHQLNPKSKYYLSFDLGFPNRLDAALGYSGDALMVHGACSSQGCYAMTDEAMSEIYPVVRDALKNGQPGFQVQAYPFRMTPKNMAAHANYADFAFWQNIKQGYDIFEVTKRQPQVSYCEGRYVFNTEFPDGEPDRSESRLPGRCENGRSGRRLARDRRREGDRRRHDHRLGDEHAGLFRRRHAPVFPQAAQAQGREGDGQGDLADRRADQQARRRAGRSLRGLRAHAAVRSNTPCV